MNICIFTYIYIYISLPEGILFQRIGLRDNFNPKTPYVSWEKHSCYDGYETFT